MNEALLKDLYDHFNAYSAWLKRQRLSPHTRRAYRSRAEQYLVFLATSDGNYDDVLINADVRAAAVLEYAQYLKQSAKAKPNSINSALTGIDKFHQFLGFRPVDVSRERLDEQEVEALNKAEQRLFFQALKNSKSAKRRAIALLFMYTGIRVSECSDLDVKHFSPAKKTIVFGSRNENKARSVSLAEPVVAALGEWLTERKRRYPRCRASALFLNPQGRRMSSTGIYLIIQELGRIAGVDVSPNILRRTCLQNLIEYGNDVSVVSQLAGHKRLRTTRRYRRNPPSISSPL